MRRADREISFYEILEVLDKCDTIRLGLCDETFPYVVPLSFGWEVSDGAVIIYFHCAKEGKKIELISKNNAVCVEADIMDGYARTATGVTADYKSVIGFGRAERLSGLASVHGLKLLLSHCKVTGYDPQTCVNKGNVAVYAIHIDTITGKRRFAPDCEREYVSKH